MSGIPEGVIVGCPYADEFTIYAACPRLVHGSGGEPCEGCISPEVPVVPAEPHPGIAANALVELVASLQPGFQWHGKGGAARQRLRIVRVDPGKRVPSVTFERTAGAPPNAIGREVTCGLDQMLAAFEPDPRGHRYAHLSDPEYSVVRRVVESEGAPNLTGMQVLAYEFAAFLARLGKRLHELAPVEGLETDDYRAIAAACVADTVADLLAAVAPEVDL